MSGSGDEEGSEHGNDPASVVSHLVGSEEAMSALTRALIPSLMARLQAESGHLLGKRSHGQEVTPQIGANGAVPIPHSNAVGTSSNAAGTSNSNAGQCSPNSINVPMEHSGTSLLRYVSSPIPMAQAILL